MLSAAYGTTSDQCFTGGTDGQIYEWNKTSCSFVIQAHTGPVFAIQPVAKVTVAMAMECCYLSLPGLFDRR